MRRAVARTVTPLVRFVEWLFGPKIPGLDLALGVLALGWAYLIVTRPQVYAAGRFVGMLWLPAVAWIGFFSTLTFLHAAGCARPGWRALRGSANLLSAWVWLSLAASFLRVEFSTGVIVYAVIGFGALFGGIFISGLPRNGS